MGDTLKIWDDAFGGSDIECCDRLVLLRNVTFTPGTLSKSVRINQIRYRTLTINFDKNVSAFGFDTNNLMANDFNLTIKFLSGGNFAQKFLVNNSQSLQFFGFQSDASDIQSVIIDGNSDGGPFAFAIDNFTFTTVPEPFNLGGILIAGSMGLWLKRKKQKGSQSV